MQNFIVIGNFLKKKYNRALLVGMNQDTTGLVVLEKDRRVRKSDMVYMDKSPDYCVRDLSLGEDCLHCN